jgi:hypothetical protein
MKTIEDILEALLINANTDWDENDPSVEFMSLYNELQRINNNIKSKIVQPERLSEEDITKLEEAFNAGFDYAVDKTGNKPTFDEYINR